MRYHPTPHKGRHLPTEQVQCTQLPMKGWTAELACDAFINPDVFTFQAQTTPDRFV